MWFKIRNIYNPDFRVRNAHSGWLFWKNFPLGTAREEPCKHLQLTSQMWLIVRAYTDDPGAWRRSSDNIEGPDTLKLWVGDLDYWERLVKSKGYQTRRMTVAKLTTAIWTTPDKVMRGFRFGWEGAWTEQNFYIEDSDKNVILFEQWEAKFDGFNSFGAKDEEITEPEASSYREQHR